MGFSNPEKYSAPNTRGIRVEGMDELMKNLRKLLTSHTEAEIRKALKPGADILIKAAKARAAVAHGPITVKTSTGGKIVIPPGTLRDSIKILPKWNKDPLGIYVGPRVNRRRSARNKVQPYYAHWIEYGTIAHNLGYKGKFVSGKGADHPGFKKMPYMRPAYDETKGQVIAKMQEGIIDMLEAKHF